MIAKNNSTDESRETKGGRVRVGKLQRNAEEVRDLTTAERKGIKGGVVISIIGVLIGSALVSAVQRHGTAVKDNSR